MMVDAKISILKNGNFVTKTIKIQQNVSKGVTNSVMMSIITLDNWGNDLRVIRG